LLSSLTIMFPLLQLVSPPSSPIRVIIQTSLSTLSVTLLQLMLENSQLTSMSCTPLSRLKLLLPKNTINTLPIPIGYLLQPSPLVSAYLSKLLSSALLDH
jgi:hypothetical protein